MAENQNMDQQVEQAAEPKKVCIYMCNNCGTSWGENEPFTICPGCGESDIAIIQVG